MKYMDKQEVRWVQRLDSYRKALERMNEASNRITTSVSAKLDMELFSDALIQRY